VIVIIFDDSSWLFDSSWLSVTTAAKTDGTASVDGSSSMGCSFGACDSEYHKYKMHASAANTLAS